MAKDFGYLEALATDVDAETPPAGAAAAVFRVGAAGPQADLDIAGIADRYPTAADDRAWPAGAAPS